MTRFAFAPAMALVTAGPLRVGFFSALPPQATCPRGGPLVVLRIFLGLLARDFGVPSRDFGLAQGAFLLELVGGAVIFLGLLVVDHLLLRRGVGRLPLVQVLLLERLQLGLRRPLRCR